MSGAGALLLAEEVVVERTDGALDLCFCDEDGERVVAVAGLDGADPDLLQKSAEVLLCFTLGTAQNGPRPRRGGVESHSDMVKYTALLLTLAIFASLGSAQTYTWVKYSGYWFGNYDEEIEQVEVVVSFPNYTYETIDHAAIDLTAKYKDIVINDGNLSVPTGGEYGEPNWAPNYAQLKDEELEFPVQKAAGTIPARKRLAFVATYDWWVGQETWTLRIDGVDSGSTGRFRDTIENFQGGWVFLNLLGPGGGL